MGFGDAVASAGPYADSLHLASDRSTTPQHSIFYMPDNNNNTG